MCLNKSNFNSIAFIFLSFYFSFCSYAQLGCTDSNASNFNPTASINNGSCEYVVAYQSVGSIGVLTPKVNESSGIVLSDGFIWSHNDSGNSNQFYKIDTLTGNVVQTLTVTNAVNNDWEDITADKDFFYLGDFGNNDGDRKNLSVLKINKLQFINSTEFSIDVTAEFIYFSYQDQTSFISSKTHNFDCESYVSIDDSLYLFTKDRGDLQTRVYKLPKIPGTYSILPYTSFNVAGLITGADYNSVTKEVVLIGYLSSHKNSFLYYLSDFQDKMFFSGNKRRVELGNSVNDWQTEGVAFSSSNKLFISCESSYVPATLYQSFKSSISQAFVSEIQMNPKIELFPNPVSKELNIVSQDEIVSIKISDEMGRIIFESTPVYSIPISNFIHQSGFYLLNLETSKGHYYYKFQVDLN